MEYVLLKSIVSRLFGDLFQHFDEGDEYAYYDFGPETINRIGYSTNITPDIIKQAAAQKVDLIITHHDAWDFLFGMKAACDSLLKEHGINHFYVHLPLDYADFGTCSSLFRALGINQLIQQSHHLEGRSVPGIGEFVEAIPFDELAVQVRTVLNEEIKAWKHTNNPIKRVGILTGAGNGTSPIRDASNAGCDVYITGEKTLYTVQYAQFIGMNLIVGSHTFTELFGIRSLAEKLQEQFRELEIVELIEAHFE